MPQALQHRIVLVGNEPAIEQAVRTTLRARGTSPAAVCADLDAAVNEAAAHPGDVHLFIVQLPEGEDPAVLASLSEQVPGQPVLALLPPGATLAKLLAAQRAGAAQIVPLPLQADD